MNQVDRALVDSQKIIFHPGRVHQWELGRDDWEQAKKIYPIYVEISPVGACNHRCTFCAVDYIGYKPVSLAGALMRERIAEMGSLGVKSVMFAGEGEPLLHKEINTTVLTSSAHVDIAITTNGVLLDKLEVLEHCKWVKVSINAGTRETYAKVHRTKESDWDRVWANIRAAVKRKGDCDIGVQMVALPENEGEWRELQDIALDAGVDYVVVKPYSQHRKSNTRQYDGYKPVQIMHGPKLVVRSNAIESEAHPYERCEATPFFWAYWMSTGNLYSCSAYLMDERFRLGDLQSSSFREIWEGERRRANWQLVRKSLDIHECRVNCRMARVNEYLSGFDTVRNASFI